ncbi:MAG TPA: undecaprenyl-diphosphate phosphatase [Symbiobacteriaceae bacterium]
MTILQAAVLGLVQGLGEFLPISSSAHLILVPWFLGWREQGLTFDVALHLGTLVAVTAYFWRDLLDLAIEGLTKGTKTPTGKLAWGVVLGTIPGALAGFLLEARIEALVRSNMVLIAVMLGLMGFVLYWVDKHGAHNRSLEDITLMDVVWIGVGQAFALIPGVSRSGATITVGLSRGLKRETAAKVSFLLSWPIIFGAGILAIRHMSAADFTTSFWVGVAVSAVTGYAVIAFLMDYLKKGTFLVFAAYRGFVAILTLALVFLRK